MILTLIGIGVLIIAFSAERQAEHADSRTYESWDFLHWFCFWSGLIIASLCVMAIIYTHIGVNKKIAQHDIEYKALCKRLEIVNSEYEDLSKSDIIKDISEWNQNVINLQYWAKNPWTSWFYSQKEVNSLKLVEY